MSDSMQQLWQQLQEHGLVTGDRPAEEMLQTPPWYVRVIHGVSGWIAALFLLVFLVSSIGFLVEDAVFSMGGGAVFIATACLLLRFVARSDFSVQFALVLSFTGQGLWVAGLFQLWSAEGSPFWLAIATMGAGLFLLIPSAIHRFWSAWVAVMALVWAAAMVGLLPLATGALALLTALVWLNELRWSCLVTWVRPLGYGVTSALLVVECLPFWDIWSIWESGSGELLMGGVQPWLGALLTAVALMVVAWRLVNEVQPAVSPFNRGALLLVAAMVALFSLQSSGVVAGLMVIVLGFAAGNRLLLGLGGVMLLLSGWGYYYQLDTTLLVKSGVLAVVGTVLLGGRWWWVHRQRGHHE